MALKSQEKDLGSGLKLCVTQHPPLQAFPLLTRLAKTLGPAMLLAASMKQEADVLDYEDKIQEAFTKLDSDESLALIRDMLKFSSVVIAGKVLSLVDDTQIDEAFGGAFKEMFIALRFIFEVNYGDFLGVLAARHGEQKMKKASA